ncbi:MAG: phage terminase large subunit [Candidatus Melainabacteria bacterium]|nr:MAG: phage terminase large subunit [Candidatus Melainabacteria bacterium]
MKYKLLPKQREFIEVPHDYSLDVAVYQGGFGSGKTFAGSLLGILLALKFPKIVGLVGALTFPMVRDTTLETYFEHLNNMGFKERKHYTYSKSECRISFKNGSKVLFRHFEQPSKLKSLNLGFVQIEEMSEVPESTFLMLLGRLRQKNSTNLAKF